MSRNQIYFILFLILVSALLGALTFALDKSDPNLIQALTVSIAVLVGAIVSPLLNLGNNSYKFSSKRSTKSNKSNSDVARNKQMKVALQTYYKVLSEEVRRVISASSSYDKEMGSQQQKMKQATRLTDVNEVIKVVAVELQGMRNANKTLRSRLNEAKNTIEAQQQNISKLSKEANVDGLTGLLNRRQFDIRHKELHRVFMSRGNPYGILLTDIDHFKKVNDVYGHQAGDAVLRLMGEILPQNIRQSDFAARYGGEEFVVLLQDLNRKRLLEIAEKIRLAVAKKYFDYEGTHIPITISIGASFSEEDRDEKQMLNLADRALYKSKRRGRNMVTSDTEV